MPRPSFLGISAKQSLRERRNACAMRVCDPAAPHPGNPRVSCHGWGGSKASQGGAKSQASCRSQPVGAQGIMAQYTSLMEQPLPGALSLASAPELESPLPIGRCTASPRGNMAQAPRCRCRTASGAVYCIAFDMRHCSISSASATVQTIVFRVPSGLLHLLSNARRFSRPI